MSPKIRGQSKKLPGHMPGKIDAWLRHCPEGKTRAETGYVIPDLDCEPRYSPAPTRKYTSDSTTGEYITAM